MIDALSIDKFKNVLQVYQAALRFPIYDAIRNKHERREPDMKQKKLLCIALAILMIVSLLAGCSTENTSGDTDTADQSSAAQTDPNGGGCAACR